MINRHFDSTAGYLIVNLWGAYEKDADRVREAPWYTSEDEMMQRVVDLAGEFSHVLHENVEFGESSIVFDYEVTDCMAEQPWGQKLFSKFVEDGFVSTADLEGIVGQIIAENKDDLSAKGPLETRQRKIVTTPKLSTALERLAEFDKKYQLHHGEVVSSYAQIFASRFPKSFNPSHKEGFAKLMLELAEAEIAAQRDARVTECINTLKSLGMEVTVWEAAKG